MIATSAYLIVFRLIHISASVAWAGSLVLVVMFVQPSAATIGPAAAPFMQELLGKRNLGRAILSMAAASVVGGLFLYWHDWHEVGGLGNWIGTRFGLGLTIGAVAAIAAFLVGLFGTKPTGDRLAALGRKAAESGGPPAPEVLQEMGALQKRMATLARANLALVSAAIVTMSTARYW